MYLAQHSAFGHEEYLAGDGRVTYDDLSVEASDGIGDS